MQSDLDWDTQLFESLGARVSQEELHEFMADAGNNLAEAFNKYVHALLLMPCSHILYSVTASHITRAELRGARTAPRPLPAQVPS